MNAQQRKELWRWAVNNRVFDVAETLTQVRNTFTALGGGDQDVQDKWIVAERQLRICELEVDNLRKLVGDIHFEPKDEPKDEPERLSVEEAKKRGVCRICQKDNAAHPPDNPFILAYGREYAHQKCLESIGVVVPDDMWYQRVIKPI